MKLNDEPDNIKPGDLVFRGGRPQVEVDKTTGCWIWLGYKCRGYGRVRRGKRPSVQAHRAIFERNRGWPVPRDMDVWHACRRRSCVRPQHMEVQTKLQNAIERYLMPALSPETRSLVEWALKGGEPNGYISNTYGISQWSVRRIAEEINWPQLQLNDEVPF